MEKLMKLRKVDPVGFFHSARQVIERMTEVASDHELTPGLSLRLVTPRCPLWTNPSEECPFPDPFWAFYWPGGQALTRFVMDNKGVVEGRSVLDLGSGCGSVSIAAARLGVATAVTANDIDPIAAVAVKLNADLNGCNPSSVRVLVEDIVGSRREAGRYDCVLLGDMFYDEEFKSKLMNWLLPLVKTGVSVYIGDPGRHLDFYQRYRENVEKVAEYKISEEFKVFNDLSSNKINVWQLCNKN